MWLEQRQSRKFFETARTVATDDWLQVSFDGSNIGPTGLVATGKSVSISTAATPGIGPNAFGYVVESVAATFEDISGTGTSIPELQNSTGDDTAELTSAQLGNYSFSFFGQTYNRLFVSTSGLITFDFADSSISNTDLDTGAANQPLIAALWDHLATDFSGEVFWEVMGSGMDERLVVQWNDVTYFDEENAPFDTVTFQAILYADGRILLNYQDIDSADPDAFDQTGGKSATVGIATNATETDVRLSIDTLDGTNPIADGTYVVELLFAEIGNASSPVFDVELEGVLMLDNYDIAEDQAAIDEAFSSVENDVDPLNTNQGIVKRFAVDVTGGDLGIDLVTANGNAPLLNGVRVIEGPPQISNVTLVGSGGSASFDSLVAAGSQYNSVDLAGVDEIVIDFNAPVTIAGGVLNDQIAALTLRPSNGGALLAATGFTISPDGKTATWEFSGGLPDDKYAIELGAASVVSQSNGHTLDGDWDHAIAPGDTTTLPEEANQPGRNLQSGNRTSGGDFRFHFALDVGANDILTATKAGGDYQDDETVDIDDYLLWRDTFGLPGDLRADGNGDGAITVADYTIWRDSLGAFSAWSSLVSTGSLVGPVVITGEAPSVVDLAISNSLSSADPYSYADEMADPNWIAGDQLKTANVGGADTISITFSEDVHVSGDELSLIGLRLLSQPAVTFSDYDVETMTATWSISGWDYNDHYLISLDDSITDMEGEQLDGEWVNPIDLASTSSVVSSFTTGSGDGTAGGDLNFVVTILTGDMDQNNVINNDDLPLYVTAIMVGMGPLADMNGDGLVNNDDTSLFVSALLTGTNLSEFFLVLDVVPDFVIDEADRNALIANYGMSNPELTDGDLDGDGDVDADDLDMFDDIRVTFDTFGLQIVVG